MLNLSTGKNDLAPVALTRRDFGKGLAAILAAGCAPSIASAAARGAGGMARMRGAAAAAAAAYDYYDVVEYLEGDGASYIKTGVKAYAGLDCDITFSYSQTGTGGIIFGYFQDDGAEKDKGQVHYNGSVISQDTSRWFASVPPMAGVSISASTIYSAKLTFLYSTDLFDDIPLFCRVNNDNVYNVTAKYLRVYNFVINTADKISLLPVLHGGEGKMLDICHNTLYANAGTGSFIVGPRTGVIAVPKQGFGANTPSI